MLSYMTKYTLKQACLFYAAFVQFSLGGGDFVFISESLYNFNKTVSINCDVVFLEQNPMRHSETNLSVLLVIKPLIASSDLHMRYHVSTFL